MNRIKKKIIVLLAFGMTLFIGSGCATKSHLRGLPKPEEFKKSLPELIQDYPDLAKYESLGFFSTIYNMPSASPLIGIWGVPHRTAFSAWMLFPPNWLFHHCNNWYWEFEGKRVSVLIDRPMAFGYRPHVWTLKVKVKK